ncbi:MAG: helix-turn-helix transcriptional regulator [Caldilineaceae bacterium]|nr:helix-turn-helix transcriptional regulator [Caldilineaceae bacterium]MCB9137634.1 helix-turn-helix transcriptional regulator [Caldilineaceae bacterium]
MSNSLNDDLVRRMQDALTRLRLLPEATITKVEDDEVLDARESVRQLARSRVAALLRQLRAVHGFSYEQVSEATGLAQQTLFDIEYKERRLTLDELGRLARCYQVSPGDILGVDLENE